MESLLFDQEHISEYYNCSNRTYEEWKALGQPNALIGFIYFFLGFVYLTLLLPFMVVFIKSDLMRFSCYKIMFYLGIIDCLAIPIGGFYCGYAATVGMVYCMAPTFNYIIGGLGLSCWCSGSTACMILAVNRCIDIMNPRIGSILFHKHRTLIWLIIPTGYFIYFFVFHTTVSFNSNFYAFFFDPFVGTPERHGSVELSDYPHTAHSIHNIVVATVMLVAYSLLFIHISVKAKKSDNKLMISKLQRQTFIQSSLVCTGTFIAAVVYIIIQSVSTPVWVVLMGQVAWQMSHGSAGISYAFLNPTMRKELVKIFNLNKTSNKVKMETIKTIKTTSSTGELVF